MRTSDDLLAELKALHPRLIDLSLGRIEAAAGQARQPAAPPAARHPCRRHQRQGLRHRLPQGHAAGRRQARARLHLAAPGALPRAHRARRRRAARRARSARTSWSTCCAHAARQRRRRHHVLRDHHGGRLPGLRRAPRRCPDPGGGARRPARRHQRRGAPGAQRHHADLHGPCRQARRQLAKIAGEKAGILKRGVTGRRSRASRTRPRRHPRRAPRGRRPARSCGARTTRPSSSAAASSIRARSG